MHKPRPTLSRKRAPSPPDAKSVNVETCGLGRSPILSSVRTMVLCDQMLSWRRPQGRTEDRRSALSPLGGAEFAVADGARADGTEFDLPRSGQQIEFIERVRGEAPSPEMPAPARAEVGASQKKAGCRRFPRWVKWRGMPAATTAARRTIAGNCLPYIICGLVSFSRMRLLPISRSRRTDRFMRLQETFLPKMLFGDHYAR